jgi:putative tryptophan/tyrosine transport system ATP-binding protein
MIKISKAKKVFHSGTANELIALNNIDLEIAEAEYIVVIGANGSGKSSLLNAIAGTLFLDSGEISIAGIDVSSLPDFERSKYISRIFQNPLTGTAPELSILDNFRLASLRTQAKKLVNGSDEAFRKKVKDKISFLEMGLEHKLDQPMGLLSGGQRQALTLIMAVMDDTKVILLDEPTAALDPKSAEVVIEKTKQLIESHKLTALLVTHEMKYAQRYGTRLIQMQEGKIVADIKGSSKKEISLAQIYSWFM